MSDRLATNIAGAVRTLNPPHHSLPRQTSPELTPARVRALGAFVAEETQAMLLPAQVRAVRPPSPLQTGLVLLVRVDTRISWPGGAAQLI